MAFRNKNLSLISLFFFLGAYTGSIDFYAHAQVHLKKITEIQNQTRSAFLKNESKVPDLTKFPCDIGEQSNRPKIYIVGESHGGFFYESRNMIYEIQASKGKVYLGQEGKYFHSNQDGYFLGIENAFVFATAISNCNLDAI